MDNIEVENNEVYSLDTLASYQDAADFFRNEAQMLSGMASEEVDEERRLKALTEIQEIVDLARLLETALPKGSINYTPIELPPIPSQTSDLGKKRLRHRNAQIRKLEIVGDFEYANNAAKKYKSYIDANLSQ